MKKNNKLVTILLASSLLLPGIAPLATGVTSVAAATETAVNQEFENEYVAFTDQVVRFQAVDNATEVAFLEEGDKAEFVAKIDLNWFKVKVGGVVGYVERGNMTSEENYNNKDYKLQNVSTSVVAKDDKDYVVAVKTPLRTGNANRFRPIKSMDRASEVEYKGTSADGQWFKVEHEGTLGFVHRADVTTVENFEAGGEAEDRILDSEAKLEGSLRLMVDSSIRTQPGKQYRVIDGVTRNEMVTYVGTVRGNKDWLRVKLADETEGYIYRGDVTKQGAVEVEEDLVVKSVSAINAKGLQVTFNKALTTEEQADLALTVNKGSITTNIDKRTFNEEGTSALITTSSKLTKGTYTVKAVMGDVTSTKTVDVENEKVSTIALTSDKAVQDGITKDKAKVFYEVKNQYGELMTGQTIKWTISTGKAVTGDNNKNEFTIHNATSAGEFIPGVTKVYITGVHTASGTVMNDSVTVSLPAKADVVDFAGVYNTDTKKIEALPAGFETGKYKLLYELKDQYGNKLNTFGDVVFTADNPLFVDSTLTPSTNVVIDGVTYQSLDLKPGTNAKIGGTVNINAISSVTGTISKYKITADSLSMVKTLSMSAPEGLVVENEEIEIPFEAYDQNGIAVTKYDDLKGNITFTQPATTSLDFKKNNDGTAKLVFKANTGYVGSNKSAIASITSIVKNEGSFSALNLDVKKVAEAAVVIGLDSDVSTTVAKGKTFDLFVEDLIIQDQYGRVMPDKSVPASTLVAYKTTDMAGVKQANPSGAVAFETTDTKTSINITDGNGKQDVSSIEFALYKGSIANENLIAGSEKSFSVDLATQSDYVSYEVADLGVMYNNEDNTTPTGTEYKKIVKVYGVKSNGEKVLLPNSDFDVSTNAKTKAGKEGLAAASGVISDPSDSTEGYKPEDFVDKNGLAITIPVKVTVKVKDAEVAGAFKATIVKDLTISNVASKGKTVTMEDTKFGGKYNIEVGTTDMGTLAGIAIKEVKDQYGVAMPAASDITISNVKKVKGSAFRIDGTDIKGAVVGDTFTVNFDYGGTVYSADFLVNDTDAKNTAQLNQNAVDAAIAGLTNDSVTVNDNVLSVPEAANGVEFTFTAKSGSSVAKLVIAGDGKTATVTNDAEITGENLLVTVTAKKGDQKATQVYKVLVGADPFKVSVEKKTE